MIYYFLNEICISTNIIPCLAYLLLFDIGSTKLTKDSVTFTSPASYEGTNALHIDAGKFPKFLPFTSSFSMDESPNVLYFQVVL